MFVLLSLCVIALVHDFYSRALIDSVVENSNTSGIHTSHKQRTAEINNKKNETP